MVPAPHLGAVAAVVFRGAELPQRAQVYVAADPGPFEGWVAILEDTGSGLRLIAGPRRAIA